MDLDIFIKDAEKGDFPGTQAARAEVTCPGEFGLVLQEGTTHSSISSADWVLWSDTLQIPR